MKFWQGVAVKCCWELIGIWDCYSNPKWVYDPIVGQKPGFLKKPGFSDIANDLGLLYELKTMQKTTDFDYFTLSEINDRDNNEDSFLVCQLTPSPGAIPLTILAVADGMGGYEHGEDVSREALKKIALVLFELLVLEPGINCQKEERKKLSREFLGDALKEAIAQTNAYIKRMVKNNNWSNSGTTLAIVLISPPEAIAANLGDSPIFHYSRGKLRQISDDHTVAKALMRGGMISSEMARHHEGKNMLELYLGCEQLPPNLPVHYVSLASGDLLLLCSDGVCGNITWKEFKNLLTKGNLEEIGKDLIEASRELGETDNQTLILCRYSGTSAGYETIVQVN